MSGKAHCCYKSAHACGGGGGSECPGKCTLSTLLLQKCSCPCGGGGGGVSGKVHYEHILATSARYAINIGIAFLFLKFLADRCPFWGPLVPLFWISGDVSSRFQSQSGFCLICFSANVIYIPWDSPLVLHMPTSLWLASQVTSPHALAEVGLGSDLNGQSPWQKTNALPLCQRPGYNISYLS